jgi:hypothetical protein
MPWPLSINDLETIERYAAIVANTTYDVKEYICSKHQDIDGVLDGERMHDTHTNSLAIKV